MKCTIFITILKKNDFTIYIVYQNNNDYSSRLSIGFRIKDI